MDRKMVEYLPKTSTLLIWWVISRSLNWKRVKIQTCFMSQCSLFSLTFSGASIIFPLLLIAYWRNIIFGFQVNCTLVQCSSIFQFFFSSMAISWLAKVIAFYAFWIMSAGAYTSTIHHMRGVWIGESDVVGDVTRHLEKKNLILEGHELKTNLEGFSTKEGRSGFNIFIFVWLECGDEFIPFANPCEDQLLLVLGRGMYLRTILFLHTPSFVGAALGHVF